MNRLPSLHKENLHILQFFSVWVGNISIFVCMETFVRTNRKNKKQSKTPFLKGWVQKRKPVESCKDAAGLTFSENALVLLFS